MDIKSLTYFTAAAKHLNFSKAAEECYISRQALRQQIQNLEAELQITLFENERNHLALTPQGKALLENSKKLLQDFDTLQQTMKELALKKRVIRLAICSSMIPFQYDIKEEQFDELNQKLDIEIKKTFLTLDACFDALENDEADCIYIFQLEDEESQYNSYAVAKKSVYIDHSISMRFDKQELDLEDILDFKFLGMGKIENTYPPLVRDLKNANKKLNYEVIPDAIETFYKVSRNEGIIFDFQIDRIMLPTIQSTSFTKYQWFIGLLTKKDFCHPDLIAELAQFLKEHYK